MKVEELNEMIEELEGMLVCLEERLSKKVIVKEGRKDEVLNLLKEKGRISVKDLGKLIGISERNISSQLSYLRKDGILIGTDSKGRKFIES
jgi:biotin operon repressor